jgi:hypothetical protein
MDAISRAAVKTLVKRVYARNRPIVTKAPPVMTNEERLHVDRIARKLRVKDHTDWYSVSRRRVMKMAGIRLVKKYYSFVKRYHRLNFYRFDSLPCLITTAYSNLHWNPSAFRYT